MLRVHRATALDDYKVSLTLTSGEVIQRDLSAVLWGPVFEPLRQDPTRFRALSVQAGTIVWPGGLDVDPDTLIWGGPAPQDEAVRPPRVLKLKSRRTVTA